jgi:hypothetical protein
MVRVSNYLQYTSPARVRVYWCDDESQKRWTEYRLGPSERVYEVCGTPNGCCPGCGWISDIHPECELASYDLANMGEYEVDTVRCRMCGSRSTTAAAVRSGGCPSCGWSDFDLA